jgi:hypothetical protein
MQHRVIHEPALRSLKDLKGYRIAARDGELGRVRDCLFDDVTWDVRYLVVNTRAIFGKEVLLYASALGVPDWSANTIPVELTREQVENSPQVDFDRPVGRRDVHDLHVYYGWPMFWDAAPEVTAPVMPLARGRQPGDPHLRSLTELTGYAIEATDDTVGHVEDFIAEIDPWAIRYMVVDTRNWLPGRKVLISPTWIDDMDWAGRTVRVHMTREAIENSPEFDPTAPVNREYEERLHDFYGRPLYWR